MSAKELKDSVIREFKLTTLALKNKNTVYILALIILGFGIYTYRNLPKELFPEITWPQILVQTTYVGNSPVDIENIITRPLEKELEDVKGLKELSSISAQDASMIFVEFNTDVDMEVAKQRVKDAVDNAEQELPNNDNDLFGPNVIDIELSELPIVYINLSGNYSIEELKKYAEYLEDQIEGISEVSGVYIEGIDEREIKINVDLVKLESYELAFWDVQAAIMEENLSMSAGEILLDETRRSIRILGEFEDMDDIRNIIVKRDEGKIVYLKDIADIIDGYQESSTFARLNREPVVSVQVVKKGGENLLSATEKIYEKLDEAKEQQMLPEDLNITVTNDQSEMVKMQIHNLENSIYIAVILVVLVLFYFLGTRNALFVGLAIPMSMLLSFVVISIIDFRINMIVLFALILALGMLVDNAIVVVENIYRFVEKGYKPFEAAKQATGEIAVAIIASTATTLAAFFPIALWHGIMGEFMKYLPITLIIVLTSSLFVALVIIPLVSATFIKLKKENEPAYKNKKRAALVASSMVVLGLLLLLPGWRIFPNLLIIFGIIGLLDILIFHRAQRWFQVTFLSNLENWYLQLLHFVLRGKKPIFFLIGTVLLLIITLIFFGIRMPNINLFPNNEPNQIFILAELPEGTDISKTNEFTEQLETDIFRILQPDSNIVESVVTTVGKGDLNQVNVEAKPNSTFIAIDFIDFEYREGKKTTNIMRRLSDSLTGKYAGVELEIAKEYMGPPTGKPINLEIIGQDFDKLIELTDTLQTVIEQAEIEGLEGLRLNISTEKPQLLVTIDRDNARRFGLSTQMIAGTIRNALYGYEISDFKVGEDEYPIMLRAKDEYRYSLPELENMKITFFDNGIPIQIPISSVARFDNTSTFSSVRRKDMDRVLTLYSNVIEGYNANNIVQQIEAVLEDFEFPVGYSYQFTGEQQEQKESQEFLMNAFLIALALVIVILVTQFNSVIRVGIIVASILFSTIGVFGGIATFRMDFIIIMTGIGIISLAGIVVNNAIVLIDYIDLLKARKRKDMGMEENAFLPPDIAKECIVQGGKTRLRPVLLTAITTILGLFPMAIGVNFDFNSFLRTYDPNFYIGGDMAAFWSPMAWTVIFGLSFATFLTLIIVPVMYRLTTVAQHRLSDLWNAFKDKNGNNNNHNE